VELSTRLSEQLSGLALGSVRDGPGVAGDLTALITTLDEVVSGYAGLRLTLLQSGYPVELTALPRQEPDQPVVTSLRIPLPPVVGVVEESGRLVVWSTVPGSLVDLAADVGYVFRGTGRATSSQVTSSVVLDADLPPPGTRSGMQGLDELATVNRAVGLLIGQGHDPGSARDVLDRRATEAGLSTYELAARLLQER
jgi:hypothetical protein